MQTLFLFLSLVMLSCSSGKLSDLFRDDDKKNDKLLKSFDLEEEVLEKFQTSNAEIKEDSSLSPSTVQTTSSKSTNNSAQVKKINATVEKKSLSPKMVKDLISSETNLDYPEDYPKEYIELDKTSEKIWKLFQPNFFEGEKTYMDINYMGVSTGKIVISTMPKVKIGDEQSYHFNVRLKTSNYYRYLYELDDTVDSYLSQNTLRPLKFSLIQRESNHDIDDLQLFDAQNLKTYTFLKKVVKDKEKKKKQTKYTPRYFVDPLSVIYFIRGLPLDEGAKYNIPIMNKGGLIILSIESLGVGDIVTKIGKKQAYILRAYTKYSGKTLKSGEMKFWFSNDERRLFLKFESKIKIGAISGEIEKYEP